MPGAAERSTNRFEQAVLDKVQQILYENVRKYGDKLNAIRFTTNSSGEIICYPCNVDTYDCIGQFNLSSEELEAMQFLAPELEYTPTIDLVERVIEEERVVEVVYYEADEGLIGAGLCTETGSIGIFIVSDIEFDGFKTAYKERLSFRTPEEEGPRRSVHEPIIKIRSEPASKKRRAKPSKKAKVESGIKTPVVNVLSQETAHELTLIGFTVAEVKRIQLVLRSVSRVLMANHELPEAEVLEILRSNIGDAVDTILKLGKE